MYSRWGKRNGTVRLAINERREKTRVNGWDDHSYPAMMATVATTFSANWFPVLLLLPRDKAGAPVHLSAHTRFVHTLFISHIYTYKYIGWYPGYHPRVTHACLTESTPVSYFIYDTTYDKEINKYLFGKKYLTLMRLCTFISIIFFAPQTLVSTANDVMKVIYFMF